MSEWQVLEKVYAETSACCVGWGSSFHGGSRYQSARVVADLVKSHSWKSFKKCRCSYWLSSPFRSTVKREWCHLSFRTNYCRQRGFTCYYECADSVANLKHSRYLAAGDFGRCVLNKNLLTRRALTVNIFWTWISWLTVRSVYSVDGSILRIDTYGAIKFHDSKV